MLSRWSVEKKILSFSVGWNMSFTMFFFLKLHSHCYEVQGSRRCVLLNITIPSSKWNAISPRLLCKYSHRVRDANQTTTVSCKSLQDTYQWVSKYGNEPPSFVLCAFILQGQLRLVTETQQMVSLHNNPRPPKKSEFISTFYSPVLWSLDNNCN